jgi:hypothetical protein
MAGPQGGYCFFTGFVAFTEQRKMLKAKTFWAARTSAIAPRPKLPSQHTSSYRLLLWHCVSYAAKFAAADTPADTTV